jgi:hypothetical protein
VSDHSGALEALERILNRGGDADDVLLQVVSVLANRFDRVTIRSSKVTASSTARRRVISPIR